jgi:hypothetical protein
LLATPGNNPVIAEETEPSDPASLLCEGPFPGAASGAPSVVRQLCYRQPLTAYYLLLTTYCLLLTIPYRPSFAHWLASNPFTNSWNG